MTTPIKIIPPDGFDYTNIGNPTISVNPPVTPATWLNKTSGEIFVCVDNTSGENFWRGCFGTNIGGPYSKLIHRYPMIGHADDVVGTEHGTFVGNQYIRDRAFFNAVTGDYLNLSANCFGLSTSWEIMMLACSDQTTDESTPFWHVTDASGGNVFVFWARVDGTTEIYFNSVSSGIIDIGMTHGRERLISMNSDGYYRVDATKGAIPNASAPGDMSAGTEFNLGTDVDSGPTYNNPLDGTIREVLVFNAPLTDAEYAIVLADLKWVR